MAAYFSGHKLLVAMPRAGVPGADIFISKLSDGPAVRVQVKTGTQSFRNSKTDGPIFLWWTSTKSTKNVSQYLWYAFVWLRQWPFSQVSPRIFVVPSAIVAQRVQACLDNNEKPFFWFHETEAANFEGEAGLNKLVECLDQECNPSI